MVSTFSLAAAPAIVFGAGKRKELPKLIAKYGKTVALVHGKSSFLLSNYGIELLELLNEAEINYLRIEIDKEPTPEMIDNTVTLLKNHKVDTVVGIGGGSVLDAGKAIAAMLCEQYSIVRYLEGVGDKAPSGNTKPFIALPTTSGTGSEATKNAVISSIGKKGFKKSLRHDNYVPVLALVDPELTLTCPPSLTAASGMDAFTQLLESYLSDKASVYTDSLALNALWSIKNGLKKSVYDGGDLEARTHMSYAALISGITLANAGLGTVHGFASSVGGFFDIPHGLVCGTLMGEVNKLTVARIRRTKEGEYALEKYAQVGKLFAGSHTKTKDYYIDFLLDLISDYTEDFNMARLSDFGVKSTDFNRIIKETTNKNNPAALDKGELEEVLSKRL